MHFSIHTLAQGACSKLYTGINAQKVDTLTRAGFGANKTILSIGLAEMCSLHFSFQLQNRWETIRDTTHTLFFGRRNFMAFICRNSQPVHTHSRTTLFPTVSDPFDAFYHQTAKHTNFSMSQVNKAAQCSLVRFSSQ